MAPAALPQAPVKDPRFDSLLGRLVVELRQPCFATALSAGDPFPVEALSPSLRGAIDAGLLRVDPDDGIQVYIQVETTASSSLVAGPASLAASLPGLGGSLQTQDAARGIVQARIPLESLEAAAALPGVRRIFLPDYATTDLGSKLTEGDAILRALQTRTQYGVDGSGVRIGVISDGIYGLATAIASGDLPPTSFVRAAAKLVATSGGVTGRSFRADGDLEAGLNGGRGAEAVAMLEIVHDLAPGASLSFANFGTSLEFNQAVNYLAANCDVVVDDISFYGGPYDGTSAVSANAASALNDPANPIRAFFTSAGNRALDHYEEGYVPSELDGETFVGAPGRFHQFEATTKTSDALALGPSPQNEIYLLRNQAVAIIMSWDDPPDASTNDYDLYLFRNSTGALVAASGAAQDGTQAPLEAIFFTNTGTQGFFDLRVQNYLDRADPRTLEIFIIESPFRTVFPGGATLNYDTSSGSVAMMADSGGGVMSVGAIDASDPDNDTIEGFSSRGPTGDGRLKPDIAGIDGVAVTGAGGFPTSFFGTSAAAPHAVAVAALLLQMAPCLQGAPSDPGAAEERERLGSLIRSRAIDLGEPGPDETFGHGRTDALASAAPMLPAADPGPSPLVAECTSLAGALVALDGTRSVAIDPTCPLLFNWTGPFGVSQDPSPVVSMPPGSHDVTLEVSQNGGVTWAAAEQTVVVQDTTPPVMTGGPSAPLLWPPNHRLETITTAATIADICDPSPAFQLDSIQSSEPDDAAGEGDGHTSGDIREAAFGESDIEFLLRAERDGAGPGREYVIHYTGRDASSNTARLDLSVRVPHDMAGTGTEPLVLELTGAGALSWSPVPGAARYQVVRGPLDPAGAVRTASTIDLGLAECLWSGPTSAMPASLADAAAPAPGRAFFYLAQYDDGLGYTGFGTAAAGSELKLTASGCH
ncbi:MAG TPA: S8 family serine peptidase [Candidatus Polarisedimenticolia bacterium]|jgi:hypothetical protein